MRRLGEAPGGKPPLEDLAKCLVALKDERETPAGSPWAPMMLPSLEAFSEHVAKAPLSAGGQLDGDTRVDLNMRFVSIVESRYRATSRAVSRVVSVTPTAPQAPPP